jgi:hypothetical protein
MNILSAPLIKNVIHSLTVDDFNIHESWQDRIRFKEICIAIFKAAEPKQIFFQFRREETIFLSEKERSEYRDEIPKYFITHGQYAVVRKIDEERFDSFGSLPNNQKTVDYLPNLWNYFYACDFFIPTAHLTFPYLIENYKDLMDDIDGLKLFQRGLINAICIKGLGGNNLIINYKNDFRMPNITEIVNSTPSLR